MRRSVTCIAYLLLVGVSLLASAPAADAEGIELIEWDAKLSANGPFVTGDNAAFRARHRIPNQASGGIEELFAEFSVGEDATMTVEGRGLFDARDYLLDVELEHPGIGSLRAGYQQFRTWYDPSGGWFPPSNTFIELPPSNPKVDRGKAWFEATLTAPEMPRIDFRFISTFRDGTKNSTIWGDTTDTGGAGARSIVPAFRRIDETNDRIEFDISHEIKATRFGAKVRYELPDIANALELNRRPGEAGIERVVTQEDSVESTIANVVGFVERKFFEDKLLLSAAYSFTDLDSDTAGSRTYGDTFGAGFDPLFANRQPFDAGYLDLVGGTDLTRHVGTAAARYQPLEALSLSLAVKVLQETAKGHSDYTQTDVGPDPIRVTVETPSLATNDDDNFRVRPELDIRYTGIKNVVLFARGDWETDDGQISEQQFDGAANVQTLDRLTNIDTLGQTYTAGVNWYPTRKVTVTSKYRYDQRNNDFDHSIDSTDNTSGNRYPAYLRQEDRYTQGIGTRVTWRALEGLRLTGRYDFALSNYHVQADGLSKVKSAEVTTHNIGADVNWNPFSGAYVRGTLNRVLSENDTPADALVGPAEGLVTNFSNDYWNATVAAGWAVAEKTDLETYYFYYSTDNFRNNSAFSQPYGSDLTENGVSAGVRHEIREGVNLRAKYGYFSSRDDASGSNNDYDAHILYGAFELDF